MAKKYIFVTGGVVSGLGKGITAASIGRILKQRGLKVCMQKFDPYINVDPGTMNPYEHGEVFVTIDGAETDLDLGHYERFVGINLNKESSISAGKLYLEVTQNERSGKYNGRTVQTIPHLTDAIKQKVELALKQSGADVIISEIGGTVGDIESLPFIEAIRQINMEKPVNDVLIVHVGLVPYMRVNKEFKTKPIQHSVKQLLGLGVQPDIIVARAEDKIQDALIDKISLFCNVAKNCVFVAYDTKYIYEVPLILHEQKIDWAITRLLNLDLPSANMSEWKKFVNKIKKCVNKVTIHLVGKYIELQDAYLSVLESLKIAGYENNVLVDIKWICATDVTIDNYESLFKNAQAILVPGGFGERGIEGKIFAVKYARENKIPFLGLCLGMQVSAIEFARNVCNLKDANSTEFNLQTKNPIFDLIKDNQIKNKDIGGTLRLGSYKATLKPNSLVSKLYGKNEIWERHRHRYEFNNQYLKIFSKNGMIASGNHLNQELVEILELENHPFFVGTQFHPEFTSIPNQPNPLFNGFIKAIINNDCK